MGGGVEVSVGKTTTVGTMVGARLTVCTKVAGSAVRLAAGVGVVTSEAPQARTRPRIATVGQIATETPVLLDMMFHDNSFRVNPCLQRLHV